VLKLIKFAFLIVTVYIYISMKLSLLLQGHAAASEFNLVKFNHLNLHCMKVMVNSPFIPFMECDLLSKVYFQEYTYKLNKTHLNHELDTWSKSLPKNHLYHQLVLA
jgi:hypothetical protein